jgi:hypothetical protein
VTSDLRSYSPAPRADPGQQRPTLLVDTLWWQIRGKHVEQQSTVIDKHPSDGPSSMATSIDSRRNKLLAALTESQLRRWNPQLRGRSDLLDRWYIAALERPHAPAEQPRRTHWKRTRHSCFYVQVRIFMPRRTHNCPDHGRQCGGPNSRTLQLRIDSAIRRCSSSKAALTDAIDLASNEWTSQNRPRRSFSR